MTTNLSIILIFILLGLGAAAPIGPVNVEIIRRHLHLGSLAAITFGAGACLADLTYLILLLTGLLTVLNNPTFLYLLGVIGSLIIAMFGVIIIRAKNKFIDKSVEKTSLHKQWLAGYLMTMLNPYTILFWVSVSAQVAVYSQQSKHAALLGGAGILTGTFLWVLVLNFFVHHSKKFITPSVMKIINYISGAMLILIAAMGEYHAIIGLSLR